MTLLAFILILISVFLHCGWNLLLKGHSPSLAFVLLLNCFSCLCMMPFLIAVPLPRMGLPKEFWFCLAGSVAGEVLFNVVLAKAYRHFDLSLFYPLVRALPVGMLALTACFLPLGRRSPSGLALLGMTMIFAGCLCMGDVFRKCDDGKSAGSSRRLWLWCLLGALGICLYTCFDNQATILFENSGPRRWDLATACAYFVLVVIGLSVSIAVMVACSSTERRTFKELCGKNFRYPLLAGIFNAICYSMVLLAYSHATSAALVFAFRQFGLPVSFLAGVFLFHEKATPYKIIGLAVIVIGGLLSCC